MKIYTTLFTLLMSFSLIGQVYDPKPRGECEDEYFQSLKEDSCKTFSRTAYTINIMCLHDGKFRSDTVQTFYLPSNLDISDECIIDTLSSNMYYYDVTPEPTIRGYLKFKEFYNRKNEKK